MTLSRFTIFILALSLITLVFWISYQVIRLSKRDVTFEQIDSKYTQELNPNFNPQTLQQLEERAN